MKRIYILSAFALLALSRLTAVPILVGEIAPSNSASSTEHTTIKAAVEAYNAANPTDLSQLFGGEDGLSLINDWSVFMARTTEVLPFGGHTFTYTAPTTFSEYYVFSRYGAGGADFNSAIHYLNAGDVLSYNPGEAGSPQGLAAVAVWARGPAAVPDSGSTAALLSLSVIALVLFRKRVIR